MSTTVTVRQLRHDLKSVEKALTKGPVKVTKRGKVIWTINTARSAAKPPKWSPDGHTARKRALTGNKTDMINVLDFLGVNYYADTSFIASLNLPFDTRHAEAVATVAALPARPAFPLSPFGILEFRNTLSRLEWKGILHRAESEALMEDMRSDTALGLYAATPLRSYAWMEAGMDAVRTLTPLTGTRTLDALHVGMARLHGAKTFLSFDANQRRAATAAGLRVLPASLT